MLLFKITKVCRCRLRLRMTGWQYRGECAPPPQFPPPFPLPAEMRNRGEECGRRWPALQFVTALQEGLFMGCSTTLVRDIGSSHAATPAMAARKSRWLSAEGRPEPVRTSFPGLSATVVCIETSRSTGADPGSLLPCRDTQTSSTCSSHTRPARV